VNCSECGAPAAPGKRFCADCGAPLGGSCRQCGAGAEPGQRFCADCGAPLATTLAAPAPKPGGSDPVLTERRVCSVLFCDLVGFTPLSESRDPEEVRELLTKYFDTARTVIERYGGVIEKFIGDAVMAVWGAPTATESDAERAVRAALDLTEAVAGLGRSVGAPDLAARAGVVTGEVAVTLGAIGQGIVAGDAVNTAARVQTAASAGQVLVDKTTWRLVREGVACAAAGEFELKGKAEPVTLWRAQRVISAVGGGQRIDGLEAPLVGREAEVRLIKELFHACADRRSARLVSLVGPPGVGKSRLGWEFFKYIDGLATTVWWHRGRCLSYGDGVAFFALAEMVRQRLGIAEDDSTETATSKLTAGLDSFVADADVRSYIRPRLAQLLGVESDAAVSLPREELLPGWRSFFEQLALESPVVLVIEDLHYADAGLLDFVEHLLDWAREVPIFVLTLARPEIEERRPGWGAGRRNATSLALETLDQESMHAMIDGLVSGMPDDARAAVAAQAQGIPLYAVETVRMLIDRDVVQPIDGAYRLIGEIGELTVPESLQSLLAARLDALPERARTLASDAAVVGTTFSVDGLVAVSGIPRDEVMAVLAELVRREVLAVRADPLSPDRGQYAFVQALFRQVAYDTLSRRERRSRHILAADHLVATFADGGEEISEVIAQHLLDAIDAAPDAPDSAELRRRAVHMLVRAGGRAKRTGAPNIAAASYSRAADLLLAGEGSDRRRAAQLLELSGEVLRVAADPVAMLDVYTRAGEIYDEIGEHRDAARATVWRGRALRWLGRMEESRSLLEQVLPLVESEPDADTIEALSCLAMVQQDKASGVPLLERAFQRAQELALSPTVYPELFLARGVLSATFDRWVEAAAAYREALRFALEVDDASSAGRARLNLSDALLVLGDNAGAVTAARESAVTNRQVGSKMYAFAIGNLLQAMMMSGDWDEAAALVDDNMNDPVSSVHVYFTWIACLFRVLRGEPDDIETLAEAVKAGVGDSEDAQDRSVVWLIDMWRSLMRGDMASASEQARDGGLEAAATALGFASETSRWGWPAAAEAALGVNDLEEVERLLEMVASRPPGNVSVIARADSLRVRARLQAARDDPAAAQTFVDADEALRATGSPWHFAAGLTDHVEYCAGRGDHRAADRLADEARRIATSLGARPLLARLDRVRQHAPA
jgi:class 3 adenylate cyclase/tetratricopeptide (TPR) repeat protein